MLLIHLAQKSWNGTSSSGPPWADDQVGELCVAAAIPGKTGPRSDTLIFRGKPAKGAG